MICLLFDLLRCAFADTRGIARVHLQFLIGLLLCECRHSTDNCRKVWHLLLLAVAPVILRQVVQHFIHLVEAG